MGTKHSGKFEKSETIDINVKMEETLISDDISIGIEHGKSLMLDEAFDEELVNDMDITQSADVSLDSDVDVQIESYLVKGTNSEGKSGWQCIECNKYSKTKANLRKHVEIHLE